MSERTPPLILNPRTLAMLRWAFSLPPEDPDRDYPQTDWQHPDLAAGLRERNRERVRERRNAWAALDRCRKCGREIEPERSHLTTCEHCGAIQATGNVVQYEKRKRLGLCPQCGGELDDPDRASCSKCRRYRSKWQYGERPAGAPARCKDCAVIFEGGRRVCDRCAEKRRIAKRVRRARGVSHNSA